TLKAVPDLLAGDMPKATLVVHTSKPPRAKPPRPADPPPPGSSQSA
ncbi:MAG: aminoacyl-tRNA hydrolase, partial [Limnohabitans sp.]